MDVLKYFTIEDGKAAFSSAKDKAISLNEQVKRKGDHDSERFNNAIKNVDLNKIEFDNEKIMSDTRIFGQLHNFANSDDFNKLVRNQILITASSDEQKVVLEDSKLKYEEKVDIQYSIDYQNPYVEKRNWIQQKFAWTRFDENKWIRSKKDKINDLNEKISNNNKYLNKLSKVSSKASENTNSIVEKNKQLFSQAGIAKNIKELNIGKQPHSTTTFKQIVNSSAPASSNVQPLSFTTSITPSYFSQNKQ